MKLNDILGNGIGLSEGMRIPELSEGNFQGDVGIIEAEGWGRLLGWLLLILLITFSLKIKADVTLKGDNFNYKCNSWQRFSWNSNNKYILTGLKNCREIKVNPPPIKKKFLGRHDLRGRTYKEFIINTNKRNFSLFSRQGVIVSGSCGRRRGRVLHIAINNKCKNGGIIKVYSIFNQNLTIK